MSPFDELENLEQDIAICSTTGKIVQQSCFFDSL